MIPVHWVLTLPLGNIVYAFKTSNFVSGKLVVMILLLASVYAWTIMVTKFIDVQNARHRSRLFQERLRKEAHPLSLFLSQQSFPDSPVYRVYQKACMAIGIELETRSESEPSLLDPVTSSPASLNVMQVGAVRNAAEREIADQCLELERRMGLLATAVSASPMLGLLGTVWGVLDAFSEMATQGAANLSAVAPGIASALMTTVVGLLVALPSAIGYNMIAGRIKEATVELDNFADEYLSEIQRVFVRD